MDSNGTIVCILKFPMIKNRSLLRPPLNDRFTRGFTIIELVLVIALLGLLAGFVIVKLGGVLGDAEIKAAEFQVNQTFKGPLLKYRIDMGSYPTTAQGLNALQQAPTERQHLWKGPYVDSIPLDPWKTPYEYKFPGVMNPTGYDIRSAGPDTQMNTEDDIGNWQKAG